MNLSGFQPCDFRGVYGPGTDAQVSPAHVFLIGRAVAARLPAGERVLVSGDGRLSTPALLDALVAGLGPAALSVGAGQPTPLGYQLKQHLNLYASCIVTASHNPAGHNGIKIQLGPLPPTPALVAGIRDAVQAAAAAPRPAAFPSHTPDTASAARQWAAYVAHLRRTFRDTGGLRIALDTMHGCYSGGAPEALAQAGFHVTPIRNKRLDDFGGETPDPAVDANLAGLRAGLEGGGFAFGAALDGDGDRARILDERGRPVDNGTLLALFTCHLIDTGRAAGRRVVVYDQKTRLAVVEALRQAGATPVREKSGHTFMRTRTLEENAILGGESSGHFFWGIADYYPVPAGDCGLFAVFAMAELLRARGRPLSELAATVPPSPFYTGDIRGLRYAGDRTALLQRVAGEAARRGCRADATDGVRLDVPGAFAHLRASVTEPDMLTAALDAMDAAGLRAMADTVTALLPADAHPIAAAIHSRIDATIDAAS